LIDPSGVCITELSRSGKFKTSLSLQSPFDTEIARRVALVSQILIPTPQSSARTPPSKGDCALISEDSPSIVDEKVQEQEGFESQFNSGPIGCSGCMSILEMCDLSPDCCSAMATIGPESAASVRRPSIS